MVHIRAYLNDSELRGWSRFTLGNDEQSVREKVLSEQVSEYGEKYEVSWVKLIAVSPGSIEIKCKSIEQ